jgi:hypothetical protein
MLVFVVVYILFLFYGYGSGDILSYENGKIVHYVSGPFGIHILVEDWFLYGIIVLIIIVVLASLLFVLYNKFYGKKE